MIVVPSTHGVLAKQGVAAPSFGTLVIELLFNDGNGASSAAGTAPSPNNDTALLVGGAAESTAQSYEGSGSALYPTVFGGDARTALGTKTAHIIGAANFKIECAIRPSTYSSRWGQFLWSWFNGSPKPMLWMQQTTGLLYYLDDNGTGTSTGVAPAIDTWSLVSLERLSGVTNVRVNSSVVLSFTDTRNYNVGFNDGGFVIGLYAFSNAGNFQGYIDQFRFWNGNV